MEGDQMKTIHVPGPPKEAFNKHRQMSDLIKAQIKHSGTSKKALFIRARDASTARHC